MEKEEIIKKLEELGKAGSPHAINGIKRNIENGDYDKASRMLSYTAKTFGQYEAEAKELAKEMGTMYVDLALKGIKEKAASDRISAKTMLSHLEKDVKAMGADAAQKYDDTVKFVYGLAPDQNESDEKIIEEAKVKSVQISSKDMVLSAKKMVRCGMVNTKKGGTSATEIDMNLQAAKSIFDVTGGALPPEYPENGNWKKGWKGDVLEYIKECISDAKEILNEYHDRPSAKQALDYANDYAELFGVELPPEYEDVKKVVGDVKIPKNAGRMTRMSWEKPEDSEEDIERSETVWQIKLKYARDTIGDLKSSDKHKKEDVDAAVAELRNLSVTSRIYNRPLPPEFYKLKKLMNWKDPDEETPKPDQKHTSEAEKKLLEELKEQKSGRRKEHEKKLKITGESLQERMRGDAKMNALMEKMEKNAEGYDDKDEETAHYDEANQRWTFVKKNKAEEPVREKKDPDLMKAEEFKQAYAERKVEMSKNGFYLLRKELEKYDVPIIKEALSALTNRDFRSAARLLDSAIRAETVQIPEDVIAPLYAEAARELLEGAKAFENDPSLLGSRLKDVKEYIQKAKVLPDDVSSMFEELSKKADGHG